ncbi:MAG: hypothetical protein JXA42_02645 [Anaerolineales bacterium]|nr:hypothetical protein [Anaerolineales bacterium]
MTCRIHPGISVIEMIAPEKEFEVSCGFLILMAFEYNVLMEHRHLNHQEYTLAAIDDVIARGKRRDWAELRRAALDDRVVMEKILLVCQAYIVDPYAQRYHFWNQYAKRYLA